MTFRHKLAFFRSPEDIVLFFSLFFDLARIRFLTRKVPLKVYLRRFVSAGKAPLEISRIEHVLRFSDFLVYGLFRSKTPCLHRSLLLYPYLTAMGIELKMVFGVKDTAGRLAGHAWLTHRGRPVFYHGDPADSYHVVLVYP